MQRVKKLWYAPLLASAMGLMMLRMLMMAKILNTHEFSDFNAGILVSSTFCMLGCLGLQAMLQREWPMLVVNKRERYGLIRAAQCHQITILCGLIFTLSLWVAAFKIPLTILMVGVLNGVAQQIFLTETVESRSRGESIRFAKQNLVRSVFVFFISCLIAYFCQSAFFILLADAFFTIIVSIGIFKKSNNNIKIFVLAFRRLMAVPWRSSLALMLVSVTVFGAMNIDRWIAVNLMDAHDFAVYSFAWIVLSIAQSFQVIVNSSFYPLLARRVAISGRGVAFKFCAKMVFSLIGLGAILSVFSYYFISESLMKFFPKYSDAIQILPIFITVAVLRVSDFWSSYLIVIGSEFKLLRLNIAIFSIGMFFWVAILSEKNNLKLIDMALIPLGLTVTSYVLSAAMAFREHKL